jgi:PAS domain S-box-containing protein
MQRLSIESLGQSILLCAFVAVLGVVTSILLHYYRERRLRREFRRYYESKAFKPQAEELRGDLPPVTARPQRPGPPERAETATPADDAFPSLASYFGRRIGRYCLAILFFTLALAVRAVLEPALQGRLPYTFFLAALLLTAWTAGIGETLLVLVLGFLAGTWYFASPGSLWVSDADDKWALALYLFIGFAIVWFMRSERAGWLQALSSDIAAYKRLDELQQERASHEQTRAVRELLANIVESAQDPILSITQQGLIVTWNPAAERLLGFSAKEAIGHPLGLIVPPERQAEQQRLLEQVHRGERTERWRTVLHRKAGPDIEVSLSISPVNDPSGKFIGASVIVRDRLPRA